MWTQSSERLDFPQVVHLLYCVEVILHALDSYVLSCLNALSFEHL
jgi:hypothetical protein